MSLQQIRKILLLMAAIAIGIVIGANLINDVFAEQETEVEEALINTAGENYINGFPVETMEYTYTDKEVEYLAIAIYCEAGADYVSDEARYMVGNVILNRVESDIYPNTIAEVLTQYKQYGTFYKTGVVWPDRAYTKLESHAVDRARVIAADLLQGKRVLDSDVLFQAEFPQGQQVVAHIDSIYFCR